MGLTIPRESQCFAERRRRARGRGGGGARAGEAGSWRRAGGRRPCRTAPPCAALGRATAAGRWRRGRNRRSRPPRYEPQKPRWNPGVPPLDPGAPLVLQGPTRKRPTKARRRAGSVKRRGLTPSSAGNPGGRLGSDRSPRAPQVGGGPVLGHRGTLGGGSTPGAPERLPPGGRCRPRRSCPPGPPAPSPRRVTGRPGR